jgi:hypothetical protein
MERYTPSFKDMLVHHHTEKDVLKVELVFGKDHTHLELKEGELSRGFKSSDRNELIDFGIKLLKEYKEDKKKIE